MPSTSACLWAVLACTVQPQGPPLTEDQQQVFAVLDAFDSLDTAPLPFVRVCTEREGRRTERHGFLQRIDGRTLQVRYLDLCRDVVATRPREEQGKPRVWFEPVDLRDHVRDAVAAAAARAADPKWYHDYCFAEKPMRPDGMLLLLARACARRGMRGEVDALWGALSDNSPPKGSSWTRPTWDALALSLSYRLALDFADPDLSWRDLLRRHDAWLGFFPGGSETVAERRNALAALVAKGVPDRAPPCTTAAELVAALRTDAHHDLVMWSPPCPVVPPGAGPATEAHPEARLERLGLEAVPALIDALGDHSPTRHVEYYSRFGGGFHVLEQCNLAEAVLRRIAGFHPYGMDRKAAWTEWYRRATQFGIRRVLAERAPFDRWAACSLLRRWPEELESVVANLRRTAGGFWGNQPLYALDELPELARQPCVVELLAELVRDHGDAETRACAGRLLLAQGSQGVEVLATLWREQLAARELDRRAVETLLPLLLRGGAAGWRVVAAGLLSRAARPLLPHGMRSAHARAAAK